jgi:putative ABC transport system permease protein
VVALIWLRGLLAHCRSRLLSTALGVAVGVALLASIGTFLASTTSQMTQRAITQVPVDWQVEAQPGAKPANVLAKTRRQPGVAHALPVSFAATTGLTASAAARPGRPARAASSACPTTTPRRSPG